MPELPPPAAPPAARPRCPRCGARLGRLAADAVGHRTRDGTPKPDPVPGPDGAPYYDAAWYCGCCGLVTAAAAAGLR